jgi:hypothetical protein
MRGRDATRSGDQLMPDEEGQELLDVCAARCEAERALPFAGAIWPSPARRHSLRGSCGAEWESLHHPQPKSAL